MGLIEELAQARDAYERREWAASYEALCRQEPESLRADDFARLAVAAHLLGRRNDSVQAMQRAYQVNVAAGHAAIAAFCAFWLAMILLEVGEDAVGSGWTARAERLLDGLDEEVAERGYLDFLHFMQALRRGRFDEAARWAAATIACGERFDEENLLVLGRCGQGRLMIMGGQVAEGLALLDEAMVGAGSDAVHPVVAGQAYCVMIEGCQEILDFGRAEQWTSELSRWCATQPDLVMFTGQCALHRGQLMRLRGAYAEALEEFERAVQRYQQINTPAAAGLAMGERGDVLRIRGDLSAAENAYAQAAGFGFDPQPGPALVWLARGRTSAAVAAAERLAAEPRPEPLLARLLPGLIEILLAAGRVEQAEPLVERLDRCAELLDTPAVRGLAGYAAASVALSGGDGRAALPRLRTALADFTVVGAAYEVARCHAQLGLAYRKLGDTASADLELSEAAAAFDRLGARPAYQEVTRLLGSTAPGGLTSREVEVLRLVAAGSSNARIAADLVLSEKTVARHLSNIFGKLNVTSRTAAAAYAHEHHLV
jgi:DNA-binding NarL/FixJ family response regulator